jgi:agmatine deiminase
VDDLSRFVSAHTIVTVIEDDPSEQNHVPLQENLAVLRASRDPEGRPFRIVELPMPRRIDRAGQRLPASYANFYIANQLVLVPTYRDPNDGKALEILQREFTDRRVVGVDSTELIWGLGSFHCISQQEPAA